MSNYINTKKYDLEERTFEFAKAVRDFVQLKPVAFKLVAPPLKGRIKEG